MSIELAREVLTVESEGLLAVRDRLGEEFVRAVDVIMACPSRLVVTGIGKSGLVGPRIVAQRVQRGELDRGQVEACLTDMA